MNPIPWAALLSLILLKSHVKICWSFENGFIFGRIVSPDILSMDSTALHIHRFNKLLSSNNRSLTHKSATWVSNRFSLRAQPTDQVMRLVRVRLGASQGNGKAKSGSGPDPKSRYGNVRGYS